MNELDIPELLFYFAHSLGLGMVLSWVTYLTSRASQPQKEKAEDKRKIMSQAILGAANFVFMCVGLTGVMLVISNNFTRALAIGATMTLMRFRIKLGQKDLGSNMIFGIIVGVACGVQELEIAWIVTILYLLMQSALILLLKWFSPETSSPKKQPVETNSTTIPAKEINA